MKCGQRKMVVSFLEIFTNTVYGNYVDIIRARKDKERKLLIKALRNEYELEV